jgi:phosphatidylserine/phosphatidylglycerophosphate/cardiolipin synthase-like enzyme
MTRVLRPDRNCDPLVRANRFALLVDGADYYATLAHSIARARRTVAMVGWDLDSRVRLGPGSADGQTGAPRLRDFLLAAVRATPQLNVYILTWDFPLLFANVRDPELVLGRHPFKHPRVHFKFDSTHPPGASHHQKIVIVDECLAFAGGMDIAGGRWDTSEHRADDVRREGKRRPYPPTHDVMALVDGHAARALAAIVRDRWHRSTGASIPEYAADADNWPDRVRPDFEGMCVGISRTDVDGDGTGPRYEVERLHLDLIEAARQSIYVENQYLTSSTIVDALCRRLQADEGPEALIVLPLKNSGWLEERTIEVLRFRSIRRLRAADRFSRLRVCYPVVPGLDGDAVQVHSKILVVDDRLFRVGSSNLTSRSMRLDTECDLTVEATTAAEHRGIAKLRNRLLAEHLGLPVEDVERFLVANPSLVQLVDWRRMQSRCLRELDSDADAGEALVDEKLIDPSEPITTKVVVESLPGSAPLLRQWLLPAALACAAITLGLWAFGRAMRTTLLPETR